VLARFTSFMSGFVWHYLRRLYAVVFYTTRTNFAIQLHPNKSWAIYSQISLTVSGYSINIRVGA
jgi:hypothetical protein